MKWIAFPIWLLYHQPNVVTLKDYLASARHPSLLEKILCTATPIESLQHHLQHNNTNLPAKFCGQENNLTCIPSWPKYEPHCPSLCLHVLSSQWLKLFWLLVQAKQCQMRTLHSFYPIHHLPLSEKRIVWCALLY